ncbi:MAG: hypothetical protein RR262_18040 [Clostridium sp.]
MNRYNEFLGALNNEQVHFGKGLWKNRSINEKAMPIALDNELLKNSETHADTIYSYKYNNITISIVINIY